MPDRFFRRTALILLLCSIAFGLTACKSMERNEAIRTERMLAAAGFQMRMADTPARVQELASLPKRTLTPTSSGGSLHYVYADDLACKCIYVGSEASYQRYQRYALKARIANQQQQAAMDMQEASLNWGAWGPWYRPWY